MENTIPEFVPNPNNPHQIHWFDVSFEDAIKDVGINRESRQELENKWKNSVSDGRAHYSNREFKRSKRIEFQSAISEYYTIEYIVLVLAKNSMNRLSLISNDILRLVIDYTYFGTLGCYIPYFIKQQNNYTCIKYTNRNNNDNKIRIVTRIRPIFEYEIDMNNYESVLKKQNDNHLINLHDGRIARSGRKLLMNNKTYFFDKVYDKTSSNDEIFNNEIETLLNTNHKSNTIILHGQTGCGKTYTMSNILNGLASKMCNKYVELIFCELHGKKCYDLFDNRKEIKLLSTNDGEVVMKNSKIQKLFIDNENSFINIIEEALKLRSFVPTDRNPISSRSHAVFVLKYNNNNDDLMNNKITIVDLAGSERKHDTINMTKLLQQESIDINFSLMALKDCIRGYYNNLNHNNHKVFINYRASLLTRILKDCFIIENNDNELNNNHHTTIIACVSPSASDVIHSMNTLDHISLMKNDLSKYNHEVTVEIPSINNVACSYIPVEKWTNENLNSWLSITEKGRFANLTLPISLDGNGLLSLNRNKLSALCQGTLRLARNDNEGTSWIIEGEHNDNSFNALGNALFSAIRREQIQNLHVINSNINL
jgi:kinesin family protein 2/24